MTVIQTVGVLGPSVPDTLYEDTGQGPQPFDLTGCSVRFQEMPRFGGALVVDQPAVIVNPGVLDGMVRYDWQAGEETTAGAFIGWWDILLADGVTHVVSPDFSIQWVEHGAEVFFGPSMDWCSTADVRACCPDATPGVCLSSAVRMASEFLYELSGEQYLGLTQAVVRPCRQFRCGFWGGPQILSEGHIVWHGGGWRDVMNDTCGCVPIPEVALAGYPVVSVDEVLIGGVAMAPTQYRLDDHRRLVRIDGQWWPACQNLAADDSQDGTWSVRYTFGTLPPELGRRAAAQLACEFWKVCSGGDCKLPSGVTQLVRQGVTVSRVANVFAVGGASGLELVDAFLAAYGRAGRPAVVWSPDIRYPRRVGP